MKAVLFDLDGTVADTEALKALALERAISSLGGYAESAIYKSVMGQSWEAVTDVFFESAEIKKDLESLNSHFKIHYTELIETQLNEQNGISNFIAFLKDKNISLGLVSSASPWMIEKVLQKLNLTKKFDVIISNADTKNHKPHPEAYLLGLEKLQVNEGSAIAFEDSNSGFQAATSAGLIVYGVKHAYNENHSFNVCKKTISSFEECLSWDIFR